MRLWVLGLASKEHLQGNEGNIEFLLVSKHHDVRNGWTQLFDGIFHGNRGDILTTRADYQFLVATGDSQTTTDVYCAL